MKLFKVSFQVKTDAYSSVASDFETAMLATSYDDASAKVTEIYGVYSSFKITSIRDGGTPQLLVKKEINQLHHRTFE